jgi:hypothetical protein
MTEYLPIMEGEEGDKGSSAKQERRESSDNTSASALANRKPATYLFTTLDVFFHAFKEATDQNRAKQEEERKRLQREARLRQEAERKERQRQELLLASPDDGFRSAPTSQPSSMQSTPTTSQGNLADASILLSSLGNLAAEDAAYSPSAVDTSDRLAVAEEYAASPAKEAEKDLVKRLSLFDFNSTAEGGVPAATSSADPMIPEEEVLEMRGELVVMPMQNQHPSSFDDGGGTTLTAVVDGDGSILPSNDDATRRASLYSDVGIY